MPHTLIKAGLAVLAIGAFASLTPAEAGYRHGHHHLYNSYPDDYAYSSNGYQYRDSYGDQYGQSDEIRELRRAFPSTNWPPSDRY